MSYTTVCGLIPGKGQIALKELRNSHGTAPPIWDCIGKKYLGRDYIDLSVRGEMDELWPLYKAVRIPDHHRSVLMMTYDRGYVAKENFARAACDIDKFLYDFPPRPGYVNHLEAILEIFACNPDVSGIGLWCTSVSDNPFDGEWNEEKEEYDPIEWGLCWEIYEELDNWK